MTYLMAKARDGRSAALAALPTDGKEFVARMERVCGKSEHRKYVAVSFATKRLAAKEGDKVH